MLTLAICGLVLFFYLLLREIRQEVQAIRRQLEKRE
jgi:hypothetical protein